MNSIVSEKGQVTIPKEIRTKLGLRAGTVLHFEAVEGKLVGIKKESQDPFSRWRGKGRLPKSLDVDGYLTMVRG